VTVSREVTVLFAGFAGLDEGNICVIVPSYCSRTKISVSAKTLPQGVLDSMYNQKPVRAMLHTQRNVMQFTNWEVIDAT